MPESYSEAALRHFADAELLAKDEHFDGAGYLIGYAVECAIKHSIVGTRPMANAPQVHLPRLIESAKKLLQGRSKHSVFTLLSQLSFMDGWSVDARYESDGHVDFNKYQQWRKDATRTLGAANLRQKPK